MSRPDRSRDGDDLDLLRIADPVDEASVERHLDDGGSRRIEDEARKRAAAGRPARGARPRRRILLAGVAAAATAVILLVLAGLPGDETDVGETPSGPLASFAALASEQQRQGPFEYIDWEYRWASPRGIDRRIRIWAGADERYEQRRFEVDGRRAGSDEIYLDRDRGLSCTTAGREPTCESIGSAPSAAAGREPWVSLWFEAPDLPTDPDELRSLLEEQIRTEFEAGISSGMPTTGPVEGISGFGPTGPFADLAPEIQEAIYTEELFAKLVGLISNPYAPPELRGASFDLLGELDRIKLKEDVRDSRGRRASEISFARESFSGRPAPGLERYELYVDPATSQVLELRIGRQRRGDANEPIATELVLQRRAVDDLPPAATPLREAAQAYEPPPPEPEPEPLPAATAGPPVTLESGPGWRLVVTDDRALEMRGERNAGTQSTYGFAQPPTLEEAGAFPTPASRGGNQPGVAKVMAGPVTDEVASVTVRTQAGRAVEAEITDAFDLRWFAAELKRGERATAITARDSMGEVVSRRKKNEVVGD